MMKSIIFLSVVVVCISSILFFVYVKYEKPLQQLNIDYVNLSIAVFDEKFNQLTVEMSVFSDGIFQQNISTTSSGFVLIKTLVNSTVTINIDEEGYYAESFEYCNDRIQNKRINIELVPIDSLNISYNLNHQVNQINLTVFSTSEFRNPIVCSKWGLHVIWLKSADNLKIVLNDSYDRCFNVDTINSTASKISFIYENYGVLDDSDFISFDFIDEKNNIEHLNVKL